MRSYPKRRNRPSTEARISASISSGSLNTSATADRVRSSRVGQPAGRDHPSRAGAGLFQGDPHASLIVAHDRDPTHAGADLRQPPRIRAVGVNGLAEKELVADRHDLDVHGLDRGFSPPGDAVIAAAKGGHEAGRDVVQDDARAAAHALAPRHGRRLGDVERAEERKATTAPAHPCGTPARASAIPAASSMTILPSSAPSSRSADAAASVPTSPTAAAASPAREGATPPPGGGDESRGQRAGAERPQPDGTQRRGPDTDATHAGRRDQRCR